MRARDWNPTNRALLPIALLVFVTGCAKFAADPIAGGHIAASLSTTYQKVALVDLYTKGNTSPEQRNIIINELMTLSDSNYQEFRTKFYANNAEFQFGADLISLGLSTAGALASSGAAPILSGASAAVQGAQGKFNSRFFLEKTSETLVNAMDTLRAQKKEIILANMRKLSIAEYSTQEGIRDVLEYHAAGSLVSALVKISAESGVEKTKAEKSLQTTEKELAGLRDSIFKEDPSGELLNRFFLPDGKTPDPENQKALRKWMDEHGLKDAPLGMFLNGAEFAAKRRQAATDLKLTGGE